MKKPIKERFELSNNAVVDMELFKQDKYVERKAKLEWESNQARIDAKVEFKGIEGRPFRIDEGQTETSTKLLITIYKDKKISHRYLVEINKNLEKPVIDIVLGEGENITTKNIPDGPYYVAALEEIAQLQELEEMNSVVASFLKYVVLRLNNRDCETKQCPMFLKLLTRATENRILLEEEKKKAGV